MEKTPIYMPRSTASHLEHLHLTCSPHGKPNDLEVALWRCFLKYLRDQPSGEEVQWKEGELGKPQPGE